MKFGFGNIKLKTLNLCIVMCTCVLAVLIYSPAFAKDYYVDKNHSNASDNNSGTVNSPFYTIQKAADLAAAGDTVYVKPGVYRERVVIKNSGQSGSPILFKGYYPDDRPVIDGSGIGTSSNGLIYGSRKDHIIIDGFVVRNYSDELVYFEYSSNITIRNCKAHGNSSGQNQGIFLVLSSDSTIEHCEVFDTGHNGISASSCDNISIQYNYVHDIPKHNGINIFPRVASTQNLEYGNTVKYNTVINSLTGIYLRYQIDIDVIGNLVYGNSGWPALKIDFHQSYNVSIPHPTFDARMRILNNTFVSDSYSIRNNNAYGITAKNNIFMNPGTQVYFAGGLTKNNDFDNNLYSPGFKFQYGGSTYSSLGSLNSATGFEANGISADPRFEDPSKRDYRLSSTSPCIDAGAALSSRVVSRDLDSKARPQGKTFDIGAYEFGTATMPPANLRIEF